MPEEHPIRHAMCQPPLTHNRPGRTRAIQKSATPTTIPHNNHLRPPMCQPALTHSEDPARKQPQTPENASTDRQCDSQRSHIARIQHGNSPKCPKNTPSGTQCDSHHSHITAPAQPRQSKSQQSQRPSHTTTTPDRKCDSHHSHITGNPARKQPQTPENAPSGTQCASRHSHITGIQHGKSPKPLKTPPQTANVPAATHT